MFHFAWIGRNRRAARRRPARAWCPSRHETLEDRRLLSAVPMISEILASAATSALTTRVRDNPADSFRGPAESFDWIELHNPGDEPIDLAGYALTNRPAQEPSWTFPAPTLLAARAYLVVFASGRNVRDPSLDERGFLHADFRLESAGEYLALRAPSGAVIQSFTPTFPPQRAGLSYGWLDNAYRYFEVPTPGGANQQGRLAPLAPVQSSAEHGLYDAPFLVELTAAKGGTADSVPSKTGRSAP